MTTPADRGLAAQQAQRTKDAAWLRQQEEHREYVIETIAGLSNMERESFLYFMAACEPEPIARRLRQWRPGKQ